MMLILLCCKISYLGKLEIVFMWSIWESMLKYNSFNKSLYDVFRCKLEVFSRLFVFDVDWIC